MTLRTSSRSRSLRCSSRSPRISKSYSLHMRSCGSNALSGSHLALLRRVASSFFCRLAGISACSFCPGPTPNGTMMVKVPTEVVQRSLSPGPTLAGTMMAHLSGGCSSAVSSSRWPPSPTRRPSTVGPPTSANCVRCILRTRAATCCTSSRRRACSSEPIASDSCAQQRMPSILQRQRLECSGRTACAAFSSPPTDFLSSQRSQNHSPSGTASSCTRRQPRWYAVSQPSVSHSNKFSESSAEPHTSQTSESSSSSTSSSSGASTRSAASGIHSSFTSSAPRPT
mmetsp:Transcript_67349/g.184699  ORF Transcript_67349/g.184699 Transcript_67349/m.184699 type:complete len:283 (-) Transcript_67349:647-1495(-)